MFYTVEINGEHTLVDSGFHCSISGRRKCCISAELPTGHPQRYSAGGKAFYETDLFSTGFSGQKPGSDLRILREAKNRFGSTNEIGVFEMSNNGLSCIDNPSAALLDGRPENSPGTCVTCVIEGSRPILAEIQALLSQGSYNPSRRSNGIDYNRMTMLLAVLDKRGGVPVSGCDAYINVIGGLDLDEPAADLATVLAAASSFFDIPLGKDIAAVGEVGLSGEIRSVSMIDQRLSEIARLGFRRCIVPTRTASDVSKGLELIRADTIKDAIQKALGKR